MQNCEIKTPQMIEMKDGQTEQRVGTATMNMGSATNINN